MSDAAILEVSGLTVEFATRHGPATVLNEVALKVRAGEVLGVVGESGCGKSMSALAIMGLIPNPPGRIKAGSIRLEGEELVGAPAARLRQIRGHRIAMIFQEPMTSLNPVFSVGDQIGETLMLHLALSRRAARDRAIEALQAVGIAAPEKRVNEYPHQLSGGMRQRVMIAMALACEPRMLIADEPTTALDVTVQAQIFDLLLDLQQRTGTAIMLITHDMGVIAETTDRVVVMYGGRSIEEGLTRDILSRPKHPYTEGLIGCLPDIGRGENREPLVEIPGIVPPVWELGQGCAFAPRCDRARPQCGSSLPPQRSFETGHRVTCWLHQEPGHA